MLAFWGLLGVLVCLALLIAKALRQESPARESVGLLLCGALFVVGCIGLNSRGEEPPADSLSVPAGPVDSLRDVDDIAGQVADQLGEKTGSVQSGTDGEEEPKSLDELCALIEQTIGDNFDGIRVTNDGSDIKLEVWFNGLINVLHDGHYAGAGADDEDWMELKSSLVVLAGEACDLIDAYGFEDTRLFFRVQNDLNTDLTILATVDTSIFFDLMDEEDWEALDDYTLDDGQIVRRS